MQHDPVCLALKIPLARRVATICLLNYLVTNNFFFFFGQQPSSEENLSVADMFLNTLIWLFRLQKVRIS